MSRSHSFSLKIRRMVFTALLLILAPCLSLAAPLKTYVAEFAVVGAPNGDALKSALPGLLTSRLNQEMIQFVEKADSADVLITGSYALFGKMFSVDVLVKNKLSGSMSKVFEQGESQDELLPAFGRLARKLERELAKAAPVVTVPVAAQSPVASSPVLSPVHAPIAAAPPAAAYKVEAPQIKAEESYVVKSGLPARNTPGSWTSEPIAGVFSSLALGRTLASGEREIFVAGERTLRYYRKGADLKQVAEISIPVSAKVLAVDTADLDGDGVPEIYVSIIDRKSVSSRVYRPTDTGLELLVDNQPWLYRGIGPDMKGRTIFVQALSNKGEYQEDVAELVKNGIRFETRKNRALPRHGTIFNFSRYNDASGSEKWAVLDEDGYLIVYAADGNELWKSSDKFGGSDSYFNYDSVAQLRSKGDKYRWNFLEQRITALADGTLILPRNEGIFSIGNNRSYSKHTLFGLAWNGAMYREAWHTRQSPSYLADYAFDTTTREVVLLEVVQKAGLVGAGKTAISINKLD